MNKFEELYFFWLVGFVCDRIEIGKYRSVLEDLYFKEFRWTFEMDENVVGWGLYLRDRFLDESPSGRRYAKIYGENDNPCSILEVMVALSINMEDKIASNDEFGDRTSEWFWAMMASLGLDIYDEKYYNESKIDDILEKFLDRRYRKDGKGGLFWFKSRVKKASNLMNLWEQAMNWLSDEMEKNGEIW